MAYVRDQRLQLPPQRPSKALRGWSADAKKAITENPDYFVWWYTVKSVGLAVVAAFATYQLAKNKALQDLIDDIEDSL